jgi:hypothetical protein
MILGTRRFLNYQNEICTASDLLYYLLTTMTGKPKEDGREEMNIY